MMVLDGFGPDAPKEITTAGGKQSWTPYRFDLLDPLAMFALARVAANGAREYGEDNWRSIECKDHLNHALQHIYGYLSGDTQDDHLAHALCRLMYAIAVDPQ